MWDVLQDAVSDSLKIFPFLFLIYIVLEIVESGGYAAKIQKLLSGKFAPAVGALAGIVPECGFSAMYAKLYDNRLITTGTLLAIFLSASDEGLIVLRGARRYGRRCCSSPSKRRTARGWGISSIFFSAEKRASSTRKARGRAWNAANIRKAGCGVFYCIRCCTPRRSCFSCSS